MRASETWLPACGPLCHLGVLQLLGILGVPSYPQVCLDATILCPAKVLMMLNHDHQHAIASQLVCFLRADDESYVHLACSEGCKMSYHHPVCYHRLVDALKQQRPGFKGFKVLLLIRAVFDESVNVF